MDFNIRLSNGQVLKGFIRSPGSDLRAVIVMVHGLGEHIQRYRDWADRFNNESIGFAGVDLPGHGKSDGKKGHIKNYSVTDEMISILLGECKKTFPGTPMFLYGHSLGGGIVLDYLVRNKPKIKGAVVTSPWLKLSFEPEKAKVRMAAFMKGIFPGLVQPSGLNTVHLSRDTEVVERYKADPLVHGKISVSLFCSAMKAAENALARARDLGVPLLLMHGSDDRICSPEGSREFASLTKLAELKIWEGGYHELHNEPFRHEVFGYIAGWIDKLLKR
ncbi:MAG TPA: lysophospholipase [Bacteroidales bacterium]|jgi:alpha-beta hydrolase superfamily lysophospholipase|nr:lysophospholipase [Bacteroidales bacterium]